jgi:hypothetical protein
MDEQLAAIYGTGQTYMDESDLEKTAAAELLVKLAEEQGVDLNDFSDAEVAGMLDDLYGGGGGYEDAGQEKFAEADYLGRVMAHSMVQELNEIEKEANKATEMASKAWGATKGLAGRMKGNAAAKKARLGELLTGSKLTKMKAENYSPTRAISGMLGGEAKAIRKARLIAGGAAGAGAVGLGVGGTKAVQAMKNKEGSALDTLAEQRAYELAAEAGYIKEASAFDYEVERRALEICEANGIPVDWNA